MTTECYTWVILLVVVTKGEDFFFETEQKFCPDLLIKKEENAQLINGKSSKNRYNKNTSGQPLN
jgi:hypothetical protein